MSISEQGKEIVRLCEIKSALQTEAEDLTYEALNLIKRLKSLGVRQQDILERMGEIENRIEYLGHRI